MIYLPLYVIIAWSTNFCPFVNYFPHMLQLTYSCPESVSCFLVENSMVILFQYRRLYFSFLMEAIGLGVTVALFLIMMSSVFYCWLIKIFCGFFVFKTDKACSDESLSLCMCPMCVFNPFTDFRYGYDETYLETTDFIIQVHIIFCILLQYLHSN